MTNNFYIKAVIDIKSSEEAASAYTIPIFNEQSNQIGSLYPINNSLASDADTIEKLTKWRSLFMQYFLTQFKASEARTASWLNNTVIPSQDRILFLILDHNKKVIGHVGVSNITNAFAELDNVIRGEKSIHPKMMFFSILSLLNWIYSFCDIKTLILHVFSNNIRAINLYNSIGFEPVESKILYKIMKNDEIHYTINPSSEKTDFEYLEMQITKQRFKNLHSNYLKLTQGKSPHDRK